MTTGDNPSDLPVATLNDILSRLPPGRAYMVRPLTAHGSLVFQAPPIWLECADELCERMSIFQPTGAITTGSGDTWHSDIAMYKCRQCSSAKVFALHTSKTNSTDGRVIKLGEWPPYGPRLPGRLMALIKPDRDLMLRGYSAEKQGMGMGAFAYYRRVVDNQRVRLFDAIIKVAAQVGSDPAVIESLEKAKLETQFSKAMEVINPSVPESLRIDGRNPLRILYAALSHHLHVESDAKCLEIASSIRVVLTALAERIEVALKDEAELKEAVGRLMKRPTSGATASGDSALPPT